jgi:hypothetical protein
MGEIACRTPSFSSWQNPQWLTCCGSAMAFLQPAVINEIRRRHPRLDGNFMSYIVYELQISVGAAQRILESLNRDSGPTAYVFIFQLPSSDAAGNGLAVFCTTIEMGLLWITLAVLILCCAQGAFTGLEGAAMCIVFLIAAAGEFACFRLVVENRVGAVMALCLHLAIIASPVLIIASAVSGSFSAKRRRGAPRTY